MIYTVEGTEKRTVMSVLHGKGSERLCSFAFCLESVAGSVMDLGVGGIDDNVFILHRKIFIVANFKMILTAESYIFGWKFVENSERQSC